MKSPHIPVVPRPGNREKGEIPMRLLNFHINTSQSSGITKMFSIETFLLLPFCNNYRACKVSQNRGDLAQKHPIIVQGVPSAGPPCTVSGPKGSEKSFAKKIGIFKKYCYLCIPNP